MKIICPTRVGMNRLARYQQPSARCHLPHARGDEPLSGGRRNYPCKHLPHTRGDEPYDYLPQQIRDMYLPHTRGDEPRIPGWMQMHYRNLPHTRGDEPLIREVYDSGPRTSAPHAWG